MIALPAGGRVRSAGGVTDMRRGMNTLALTVRQGLGRDPHAGGIFCCRGRKGDPVKLLRLEAGKVIWPTGSSGAAVQIPAARLGHLPEGMGWPNPRWTQRPAKAGENPAKARVLLGIPSARDMLRACLIPLAGARLRRPGRWSRLPGP